LNHLVSPYGLALASYALFLVTLVFPPELYTRYMLEPDLIFLDGQTFVFYTLCVIFFIAGVAVVDQFAPARVQRIPKRVPRFPFAVLAAPVCIGAAFCILSSVLLLRQYPAVWVALLSQGGNDIKESDVGLNSPLGMANTYLLGILSWALWRYAQSNMTLLRRLAMICIFLIAVASCLVSSALKLSRGELMPTLCGMGILYLLWRAANGKLTRWFCARFMCAASAVILAVFLLFSSIRGKDSDLFATELLSYGIAGYNRLSALVHGTLHYPYAGHGVYVLNFVVFNNMLNHVIPLREIFRWPSFLDVWQSEFGATSDAGLYGFSIFSGAFGYIFSEMGWFSPLLLFAYGLLYGGVWRSFKRGSVFGIVMYPWFAFCILFWFGTNFLFDNKLVVLLLVATALTVYERLTSRENPRLHVPD
jgi:hypothetical protein